MTSLLEQIVTLIILGLVATVVGYAVVRSMSFAYFRTKLEYWRTMRKESTNGKAE